MKAYLDFGVDGPSDDIKKVKWTRYKIIVPTKEDKEELMEAFEHFHDSDIDTDFVTVNQLAHEYLDFSRGEKYNNNIIVNKKLYELLDENQPHNKNKMK